MQDGRQLVTLSKDMDLQTDRADLSSRIREVRETPTGGSRERA